LEQEHKLYLYGGSTFILLPESAWLDVIKSEPAGWTVCKSVDDAFLSKGWVKVNTKVDPDSHESTIEWVYEETGAKVKTTVDKDGQLKVNGKDIGSSTIGESYKKLAKMAEDARLIKQNWVNPAAESKDAKDKSWQQEKVEHPWTTEAQAKRIDADHKGMDKKPEEKGGPSPMCDVMSSTAIANMQLIGKYDPLIVKENLSPPERMQKVNRLLELAEKEENEMERQRLLEMVDRELDLVQNAANVV